MKKLTRHYFSMFLAAMILTLLCVSGCTGSEAIVVDVEEDNSFEYLKAYAECDDETLNSFLELAKILGNSWYRDGDSAADSGEHSWLLDYAVSAHTQDGRGAFALHVPGSAGMSQVDFVLLTTQDYGKTWTSGGGLYHIVGDIAQITINDNSIYMIVDSEAYGNSYVLMSEDFGGTFKIYNADHVIPAEYRTRMSELYGVYMRIVNVENDGEMVLDCFCKGYIGDISFDDLSEYDSSVISDEQRTIMILSSDANFSEIKTLYADERIF